MAPLCIGHEIHQAQRYPSDLQEDAFDYSSFISVTSASDVDAVPNTTLILEFEAKQAISTAVSTRWFFTGHTLENRSP